jgi:hypothetical protein
MLTYATLLVLPACSGFLIIAQPQSASTSLAEVLASALTTGKTLQTRSLGDRQNRFDVNVGRFWTRWGSDGGNVAQWVMEMWVRERGVVWKQHLLPTPTNIARLRNVTRGAGGLLDGLFFLFRDVNGSVASFGRR